MSSHRVDEEKLDQLIYRALHDSVADADPSPQVWERIQKSVLEDAGAAVVTAPAKQSALPWYARLGQLMGVGVSVTGDPRLAWQRRLYAFDMRAPVSVMRIVEGRMAMLRMVS